MTSFYIDVSHYDFERLGKNLDWPTIKSNGIDTVIIRATYGDPQIYNPETRHFVEMAQGAKKAGLNVGGYHNLIRGDLASIQRQVQYFTDTLNSVDASFAMVDVEPYQALVDNGLWPRLSDAELFAQEFSNSNPDRKLAVYLPKWVWSGYLNSADLTTLMANAKGPLVSSNYPMGTMKADFKELYAQSKGDVGPGWLSYGSVTPEIWQYSSNSMVPGASSVTDVNAFKGSTLDLQSRLRKEGTMAWVLTKNLIAFRNQLNAIAPKRDKTSDGSIGDAAHQAEVSGHNPDETANSECKDSDSTNEVRAIDVDKDLNVPGLTMEDIVQHLLKLARTGKLSVIRYIIYNRRIWSASSGWVQKAYTGSNPHDKHMHLSGACNQTADEAANFDYHLDELVDDGMAEITQARFNELYLNAINSSAVATQEKARAWQYTGGGLPDGQLSTLSTLSSLWTLLNALASTVAAESTNPEELQAALASVPNAVVAALGGGESTDNLVATLKSVLSDEQLAALKAAL